MIQTLRHYRLTLSLGAFMLLNLGAILMAPAWYENTTILNTILLLVASYHATSLLFGGDHNIAWAILWSILIVGPLRWFLGIIEVSLYWYLFLHRRRTNRRGANLDRFTADLEAVNDEAQRPREVSTGSIKWRFLKKGMVGSLASFTPRMWCNIPQFWRRIEFVQSGKTITVIEHRWFHQPNRQNLVECHDPDYVDHAINWLIAVLLRNRQVNIVRHGKMSSGKPERCLRFRLGNVESEKVLSVVEILINDTCTWQGAKRLGHF